MFKEYGAQHALKPSERQSMCVHLVLLFCAWKLMYCPLFGATKFTVRNDQTFVVGVGLVYTTVPCVPEVVDTPTSSGTPGGQQP